MLNLSANNSARNMEVMFTAKMTNNDVSTGLTLNIL
jgi:hypothetical protein